MLLAKDDKVKIPILPNLITTGSIFAGFYSVIHSIQGDYTKAAWAIVLAGVCDNLDGRVARWTKGQSEFGVQYDSLSDMFSFGFAPAMLAYMWALKSFGKVGWLVSFIFLACAALRLARFNVKAADDGGSASKYFQGLPTPGGAGMTLSTVLMSIEIAGPGPLENWFARGMFLILVLALALFMVSGMRFRTFKDFSFKTVSPLRVLVIGAVTLAVFMISPEILLFLIGITYISTGIIETIFFLRKGVKEVLDPDDYNKKDDDDADGDLTTLIS